MILQKKDSNNSKNIVKIGKYTLHYPEKHSKKKPIHKEAMKQLRNEQSDTLDLSWGKFKRFKWHRVLKYMKVCEIQRILAYGNSDKRMLSALSNVTFTNLTLLDLRDSEITSIECLPFCPTINYLSLINNNICSISVLKKHQFSNLKTLLLNDNPISEMQLDRCNFKLETFWLEKKYNKMVIKERLSETGIFKLDSTQMKDVSVESFDRIYEPKSLKRIKYLFSKLERFNYLEPDDQLNDSVEFITYLSDQDEEILRVQNAVVEQNQAIDPPPLYFAQGSEEEDWLDGDQNEEMKMEQTDQKVYIDSKEKVIEDTTNEEDTYFQT